MNRAIRFLSNLGVREEGQTLTEYALILSVISISSIAFLTPLSDAIDGLYTTVSGAF
jgi:Flp pilus assembly pilin Flp